MNPPEPSPADRRRAPRIAVDLPARVVVGDTTRSARVRDLCRDAALVETGEWWPLGTPVRLVIELPDDQPPLEVPGAVVRQAEAAGRKALAVLFHGLTPGLATRLDFLPDSGS